MLNGKNALQSSRGRLAKNPKKMESANRGSVFFPALRRVVYIAQDVETLASVSLAITLALQVPAIQDTPVK
jgi:hypothetical protein